MGPDPRLCYRQPVFFQERGLFYVSMAIDYDPEPPENTV